MARTTRNPIATPALVALLLASVSPAVSRAGILLGNTSATHALTPPANTIAWPHSVGSAPDRILVVGISFRRSGNSEIVSGITYGGTPLLFKGRSESTDRNNKYVSEIWYLVGPPPGTQTLQATFSGPVDAVVGGAATFTGVAPSGTLGDAAVSGGTAGTPSVVVPAAAGEVVLGVLSIKGLGQNAIVAGPGQTECWNDSTGNDLNTHVIGSASTRPGAPTDTLWWNVASEEQWAAVAVPMKPAASAIWGTVFEDPGYGGGAGRDLVSSAVVPRPAARAELYDSTGTYITAVTSGSAGNYAFTGLLPGRYAVRIVNASVSSSRSGYVAGTHLAVQTFRTIASGGIAAPVTDHVGGQAPSLSDAPNGKAGATMNLATGVFTKGISGTAQSVAPVLLSGGDVAGVDFGYSFDVIVNTNATGQGSLRQFLINANALSDAGLAQAGRPAGIDNAIFMLADGSARPGMNVGYPDLFPSGVATIAPTSALPTITSPLILDARTQPGWTDHPLVELDGSGAGAVSGPTVTGGSSTIAGFVINRWRLRGIELSGGGANTIVGNRIGTDAAGAAALPNLNDGILINGSPDNVIGGSGAAEGNLISGNRWVGLEVKGATSTGNRIVGNYIGVDATGTVALPNLNDGIDLAGGSSNTTVGGTTPGAGNVVSGHSSSTMDGIWISGSSGNVVQGNRIGTDTSGTAAIPNSRAGVYLLNATGNTIGGNAPGAGNTIAYNDSGGVLVLGSSNRNAVIGNAIFGNRYLGVDLNSDGVTPNDGAESLGQPNAGMDFPVFTGAVLNGGRLDVAGWVGSAPGQTVFAGARVELFRADPDPSGHGEGREPLGTLGTDGEGRFVGSVAASGLSPGDPVTALATDANGNTSEFSDNVTVTDTSSADLALTGSVSGTSYFEYENATFKWAVENLGPSAVTNARVTGLLTAGLSYVSDSASTGAYGAGSDTWTIPSLPAGTKAMLTLVASVGDGTAGTKLMCAPTVGADQPDPIAANDTARAAIMVEDWGVSMRTGTYTGDGSPARAIAGLGFRPDFVMIKALGFDAAVATTSTMVGVGAKELGPTSAPLAGQITSLDADGFTVGADNHVNGTGIVYSWVACPAGPGAMAAGSYTGDGLGSHGVSIGFQPDYVIVMGEGAVRASQRFSTETSNLSTTFGPGGEAANTIQTFESYGFTLGSAAEANTAGSTYHYAAWRARPNTMSVGTYLANGADNQIIGGAGFEPEFVIVKSKGYNRAVQRTAALSGDQTLPFAAPGPAFANGIQQLVPDGYEAGTDSTVNALSQIYHWAAFRSQTPPVTADLSVAMSVDDARPNEGDTLTFRLTLTDLGPDPVTGVTVNDALPAGLEFVGSVSSQGSYAPATGIWSAGGLASGTSAILDLAARVAEGAGGTTISNAAFIASGVADSVPSNNAASVDVTVQSADLAVSVAVDDTTPNEGQAVMLTVTLRNHGPDDATEVAVTDRLPTGLAFVLATPPAYDPATGIWAVGTLGAGDSTVLAIRARVYAGTGGTTLVDTTAVTAADQADPVAGNGMDSVALAVQSADLVLGFAATDSTPDAGGTLSLGIVLLNSGPDAASGIVVADSLPAGLTFVSATPGRGSYDPGTRRWTIASLPADSTASLGLTVTVDPGTADSTLTAGAWIEAADQADPQSANNARTVAVVPIVPGSDDFADLAASKVVDRATPNEGDTLSYVVTATNEGPDPATGLAVTDSLPAGLRYVSAAGTGSYDAGSGVWTIGALDAGASAVLNLEAVVDTGTGGRQIFNTASITTLIQHDTLAANDQATAAVRVQSADLSVATGVDVSRPLARDSITFTVDVVNLGPDPATGVVVRDTLPAGIVYGSSAATAGAYDPATGEWAIGTLASGTSGQLTIRFAVDTLSGARTVTNEAFIAGADQADPDPTNDRGTAEITIQTADVAVAQSVDQPRPAAGASVVLTIVASNAGPDSATGVVVSDPLPPGLTYLSAWTSAGTYTWGIGAWNVGSLAPGIADTLAITARVPTIPGGAPMVNLATVVARDQVDPDRANDAASVSIEVPGLVAVSALPQSGAVLPPLAAPVEVLRLALVNRTAVPETLETVTLANTTNGPGTTAELDAEWQPVGLSVERSSGGATVAQAGPSATFANGSAVFDGLGIALTPADTVRLVWRSGASRMARDGDALDLALAGPSDLVFRDAVDFVTTWPLAPSGAFVVDGMTAAQIEVRDGGGSLLSGSRRNVVLSVVLPSNGYRADQLNRLNVDNTGTAEPVSDIEQVEAWTDADGDSTFDPAIDAPIGVMSFTGNRWELTGLTVPVPVPGLQVFVTCDPSVTAREGRTVHFGLPAPPDVGVGMQSGNDGPNDVEVPAVATWTISTADRVALTADLIAGDTVAPGRSDVPLLELTVTNTYTTTRTLASLRLVNTTTGPGTMAQHDEELAQLTLRADGNDDGVLDPATDPRIGTAYFGDGTATFTGANVAISPGASVTLFVTGDVSLQRAADGDVLAATIADAGGVTFSEATAIAASWPLDSGARWTVDGMVSDQMVAFETPVVTIGPDEGPVLAFDALLPSNGYASDVLREVRLENAGSALPADLAAVRLWKDGGDSSFDAGGADDTNLGPMVWLGGQWVSQPLSETVGASGVRVFASIVASATPTTGATVQLRLPRFGVGVESANDGPVDVPILNPDPITISTAALLTSVTCSPSVSTVGQTVTAEMRVRNTGDSTITSIAPSALTLSGDGSLGPLAGPTPVAMSLAPGAENTFVWTFRADSAGSVRLAGSASGLEAGTGLARQSLATASNLHRVFRQADGVDLFPIQSMPFSINRGQSRVVPLGLTFTNPGGSSASDVRLRRLTVRLEDASGAGVVPAALLSHVMVNEGTSVYLDRTALESSGATMNLNLATPVLIPSGDQASGQVTLSLSLTVLDTTDVPSFRVVIDDSNSFQAEDATNGAPIAVRLDAAESYPVRSGLARVVAEATQLDVVAMADTTRTVGPGQTDVPWLDLGLTNPGPSGLGSDARVSAFSVVLRDSTGAAVPALGQMLSHVTVRAGTQILLDRAVAADEDSILDLAFTSPLNVPVAAPVPLTVTATIGDGAGLGDYRLELAGPARFDVREVNTGAALPAFYATNPLGGPLRCVRARADSMRAGRVARLPASTPAGAHGVTAMTLVLEHLGGQWSGAIRCDSLTFRCRGQAGEPLVAADYIDKVRIRRGGVQIGELLGVPAALSRFTIPLTDMLLVPGQTDSLEAELDFEIGAPTSAFELIADATGIHARDANIGSPVSTSPRAGAEFPLSSGMTQMVAPAHELAVGFTSRMPAALPADGATVPVATLTLRNAAAPGSGPIELSHLDLRAGDRNYAPIPFGRMVSRVQIYVADSLWADSGILPDTTAVAALAGSGALELHPLVPVTVEARAAFRDDGRGGSLRIGCDAAGIGVVQPGNSLLDIAVTPEQGRSFPYWTEAGNLSGVSLQSSYSNFPNPFAAGREKTRFAFYLPQPARVTLSIWSARGERVRTLLSDASFDAGLDQSTRWDGRNGRGDVVVNGVYIAEIEVTYSGGSRDAMRRKVAVVR